ncbi:MAG: TIGR02757 family protein [Deltaproteobacteria bacterium]|nr:TIGR02757 family protein [Deltaproteobacteria bacterium]
MEISRLRQSLEDLYRTYDIRYLQADPLSMVHRFSRPEDREVAGLIAAAFSYGRVPQILKTLKGIFAPMAGAPYAFVQNFDLVRDGPKFSGLVHRFNNDQDLICLLIGLQQVLKEFGSVKGLFLAGYAPSEPDIGPALTRFVEYILALDYSPLYGKRPLPPTAGVRFLLPSPRKKSACKRLNMYLRWMVRCGDSLDLGLWREISPAKLLIPLDTHVARIAKRIGLTKRTAADWRAVREITEKLRRLDPEDPVRYDFALAHLGILQQCGKEVNAAGCAACVLEWTCRKNSRQR